MSGLRYVGTNSCLRSDFLSKETNKLYVYYESKSEY